METIDLMKVAQAINPDTKCLLYEENKHLFTKVAGAFDVFQMNSSSVESYWILEKGDDGQEYLVAQYEDSFDEPIESINSWEALSDRAGENVTLSYKNVPIKRLASSEYGFNSSDVHIFIKALTEKLDSDQEFVDKLVKTLPKEKNNGLTSLFPELQSAAAGT